MDRVCGLMGLVPRLYFDPGVLGQGYGRYKTGAEGPDGVKVDLQPRNISTWPNVTPYPFTWNGSTLSIFTCPQTRHYGTAPLVGDTAPPRQR